VLLLARITVTPGANVTGYLFSFRRGTAITSFLVPNSQSVNVTVTPGAGTSQTFTLIDTPPPSGGVQYSFTAIATAGAAVSAVGPDAVMLAVCL
jgi:hypothetical protein